MPFDEIGLKRDEYQKTLPPEATNARDQAGKVQDKRGDRNFGT